jgi:hypothetical protein
MVKDGASLLKQLGASTNLGWFLNSALEPIAGSAMAASANNTSDPSPDITTASINRVEFVHEEKLVDKMPRPVPSIPANANVPQKVKTTENVETVREEKFVYPTPLRVPNIPANVNVPQEIEATVSAKTVREEKLVYQTSPLVPNIPASVNIPQEVEPIASEEIVPEEKLMDKTPLPVPTISATRSQEQEAEVLLEKKFLGKGIPLSQSHPELIAQWHPTLNGDLTPDQIATSSNLRVWWQCLLVTEHVWEMPVFYRTAPSKHRGCPYCAHQRLSITNSLATLYPQVAALWHPTKNGELSPTQVIAGSNKQYWWLCDKGPDHEWQASANSQIHKQGYSGCPFCMGKRLSVTNSLATRFPNIAVEWHLTKNEPLRPSDVIAGTQQKVWWQCQKVASHEWQASVNNRTGHNSGCPYCYRNSRSHLEKIEAEVKIDTDTEVTTTTQLDKESANTSNANQAILSATLDKLSGLISKRV